MVRERIVYRLNFRVCQQLLVRPVGSWDLERGCNPPGLLEIARSNGDNFRPCAFLHSGNYFCDRDLGGSDNSPTYLVGHRESFPQPRVLDLIYLSLQSEWPQLHRMSAVWPSPSQ